VAADFDAVLTAIRGVLVDNNGNVRTVGANRFRGEMFATSDDAAKNVIVSKPRVEARIASIEPHPARPLRMGSFTLYNIGVEILTIRDISGAEELIDSRRDDVRALAANDADLIAQAVEYAGASGNLAQTAGASPTGLVSGVLTYVGSDMGDIVVGAAGSRIESTHKFTGVVNASMATS